MQNNNFQTNINIPQNDTKEPVMKNNKVSLFMIVAAILFVTNLIVIFYAWVKINNLNLND